MKRVNLYVPKKIVIDSNKKEGESDKKNEITDRNKKAITKVNEAKNRNELVIALLEYLRLFKRLPDQIPFLHKISIEEAISILGQFKDESIFGSYELMALLTVHRANLNYLMQTIFVPVIHSIPPFTFDFLMLPISQLIKVRNDIFYCRPLRLYFRRDGSKLINDPHLYCYTKKLRDELLELFSYHGKIIFSRIVQNEFGDGRYCMKYSQELVTFLNASPFYYSFLYFMIRNFEILIDEYLLNLIVRATACCNFAIDEEIREFETETDYMTVQHYQELDRIAQTIKTTPLDAKEYISWGSVFLSGMTGFDHYRTYNFSRSNPQIYETKKAVEMMLCLESESPIKGVDRIDLNGKILNGDFAQEKTYLNEFLLQ